MVMEVAGTVRAVRESCETFCAAAREGSRVLQDASSETDTSCEGSPIQADDAQGGRRRTAGEHRGPSRESSLVIGKLFLVSSHHQSESMLGMLNLGICMCGRSRPLPSRNA